MKRVWIVCALLLAVIAAGIGAILHLHVVTNKMESSLNVLKDQVGQTESDQLSKLAADFELEWEKNECIMTRYIHHDELDTITGTVARLKGLAQYDDKSEFIAEIDLLRHLIKHIYESELPTFENIL